MSKNDWGPFDPYAVCDICQVQGAFEIGKDTLCEVCNDVEEVPVKRKFRPSFDDGTRKKGNR